MRFLKWGIIFAIAFAVSWIVIFTFNQEPFKIQVPAKILFWQTRSIPVYAYITGAFALGLFIGICVVVYDQLVFRRKISKKNKEFRKLENDLAIVTAELGQCRQEHLKVHETSQSEQNKKPGEDSGIGNSTN
jgi:uncharacterized integral membrane protein